eukprot:913119-Pyramimonas_sp.AAC.1
MRGGGVVQENLAGSLRAVTIATALCRNTLLHQHSHALMPAILAADVRLPLLLPSNELQRPSLVAASQVQDIGNLNGMPMP